ncbi:hypothetical protein JCM18899A_24350 [Nocardioides sp. AN3]
MRSTDRRKLAARYVVFADAGVQYEFAQAAESAFQVLARLDQWAGRATLVLDGETSTERRRFLRRAAWAPVETLRVTAGLAGAWEAGRDVPAQTAALGGCDAEQALTATMGHVVCKLARDLADVAVGEQRDHPAYGQTLRLAAELQALHTILDRVGCGSDTGCVRAHPPEPWRRRVEDVEVTEVRAVLLAHGEGASSNRQP